MLNFNNSKIVNINDIDDNINDIDNIHDIIT